MNQSPEIKDLAAALVKAQGAGDRFSESIAIVPVARATSARQKPTTDIGRFLAKIVCGLSDCWFWHGSLDSSNYGRVTHKAANFAHRLSWHLFRGPIPEGMRVLHRCDVRNCVNPDHLFLGTQLDNIADMVAKGRNRGRAVFGEANPVSKLTTAQVLSMREERRTSGTSYRQLSKKFGVTIMTAFRATSGQSWSHL